MNIFRYTDINRERDEIVYNKEGDDNQTRFHFKSE